MGGTRLGGVAAAATNKEKYGEDFFQKLGALGGARSRGGGFGQGQIGRERARLVGSLGGRIGRRNGVLSADERAKIKAEWLKKYDKNLAHLQKIQEQARSKRV